MNLHQCFLTKNGCYIRGDKIVPKGVMVHSTGCDNTYLKRYVQPDDGLLGFNIYGNDWNQYSPDGRLVCVHAFIGQLNDDTLATYQTLPWDYRGWHCGKGPNGSGNDTHISFEMQEDDQTNPLYFIKVYNEAVEFAAMLVGLFDIPIENVICHCEGYAMGIATDHSDVMEWFSKHNKTMDDFRADVKMLT